MTNKRTIRAMRAQRKKPKFLRPDSWKFQRLKASWRRPHGIDNKIRQQKKGYPPKVKPGYRSPSESRGLHPSGFTEVIIYSPQELALVDRKKQIVTIASTIGARKKAKILERASEWAIRVANPGLGPRALEEELELEFSEEELEALEELDALEEDDEDIKPNDKDQEV